MPEWRVDPRLAEISIEVRVLGPQPLHENEKSVSQLGIELSTSTIFKLLYGPIHAPRRSVWPAMSKCIEDVG